MSETQKSIAVWADETFGPTGSNARVAARANEEMSELLRCLTADDNHAKAPEEIADVVIVLNRLAARMGHDIGQLVDAKMAVNRQRTWQKDGTGHGYHVRNKQAVETPKEPLTRCASASDGECFDKRCPQLNDGEPAKTGRSCPLFDWSDRRH